MLQGMSAVIASPPSVKASFLKGICVRAITSFSGNMLYKHKDNFFFFFFCALSGAKTISSDQSVVLRHL